METWVSVFLAIIALQTLIQAGFVVGLAVGARRGGQALAAVEARVGRDLARHSAAAANACERAAVVAEMAQEQAERAGAVLADADTRLRGALDLASGMVSRAADHAPSHAEDVDDSEGDDEAAGEGAGFALPGRLGQAFAIFRGAQRAWAVWNAPNGRTAPEER
jgi:hypothetical protein